jgi:hypothetical protein
MRFLLVFTVIAGSMLATIASAQAVTYGPITMSVPLSVNTAFVEPGTYAFSVTCTSPKTATYSGIAQVTTVTVPAAHGPVTFGPAPVLVPLSGGLQSGATVTCTMIVNPPSESAQLYLGGLTYDPSKMTTKFVLP